MSLRNLALSGRLPGLAFLGLAMLLSRPAAAQEPTPEGYWEGAIEIRGNPLDIAVELRKDAQGSWSGTIDIPAQNARGVPLANVMVEGREVAFAHGGGSRKPGVWRNSGRGRQIDRR